jgi:hypothetical protein
MNPVSKLSSYFAVLPSEGTWKQRCLETVIHGRMMFNLFENLGSFAIQPGCKETRIK